jgi:hypothetical protein
MSDIDLEREEAMNLIDEEAAPAKKPRAKKAEVELSTEEVAAKLESEAKVAEIKLEIDTISANLSQLKAQLKELTGKSTSTNRGPVGVGAFIKELIKKGLTNAEISDRIITEWPENNTNTNCINWYRNALKAWPDGKRPKKVVAED